VNQRLFPYLKGFKQRASGPNTIEYKIGEIFSELSNKISSGYNLREIIDGLDGLRLRSQAEKHELSMLYEEKIKRMGNAGRNGGEHYTPRPLIRAIVQVVNPITGETVYDPAVGSAGFLCEAFEFMRKGGASGAELSTADLDTLQTRTFTGKEKKSLAYVIAIKNMILHGIEAPKIIRANTLTENLSDVQERDRLDVILANPPFGGSERKEVQQNFEIRSGETAFLFLQHFIRLLRAGGRAGVVIKNTFLSNTDNASVALRQKLLTDRLQPAHGARLPRRHLPGGGGENGGAVLREGIAHPQGVILPARSRPQPGQNQPAQRPRPGGVCGVAENLC
jgi:type I restriction enzyme M protein